MLLLAFALIAAPDSKPELRFLTSIVAAEMAKAPVADVISAEDMRRVIELEADKRASGCANDDSCLAEVASAMDARFVVYGTVDVLDDDLLLQLALYDAKDARTLGRARATAKSRSELATNAERCAAELVTHLPREGDRVRVLILDMTERLPVAEKPAPIGAIVSWTAVAAGAAAVVVGGLADVTSATVSETTTKNLSLSAVDARARYAESDGWAIGAMLGYASGALLIAGGAVGVALTWER